MSNQEMSKHDHVLLGLMYSLQAAAMQQLGKVQDPATGEVSVSLDQARATIDVLEMLKAKCRTDTPEPVLRMLDQAVLDLQMNYLDELKKERSQPSPADDAPADEAAADEAAADEAPADEAPADDEPKDPDA